MRTRLSTKKYIITDVMIAFLILVPLSLPIFDLYGLLSHIIIPSNYDWIILTQRFIHLVILYFIVRYFNKQKTVLTYDQDNLYIDYKQDDTEAVLPLHTIQSFILQPNFVHGGTRKYIFELSYTDDSGEQGSISVPTNPGKALSGFEDALKKANPHIELKNWSFS